MKYKKMSKVLVATALACSLVATPVFATPEEDKERLEQQKEDVQNEANALQSQLNALLSKMNDLESQLISKGEEIIQAEEDLKAAEEKEKQQYADMKLRIKYFYETGNSSAIEMFMEAGNITEMLSKAEYAQKMQQYDRDMLAAYGETVQQVKDIKSTLEEEQRDLEAIEAQYESEQASVSATLESKKAEVSNLDDMIQEAARKAEEERLRREEEQRRREEEARRQQEAQNNRPSNNGGNSSNGGNGGSSSNGGSSKPSSGSKVPTYNPVTGNIVVDRAYGCLGIPYKWGATGPSSFDCSGLVGYAITGTYNRIGTTHTFMGYPRVSDPQPGDIVVNSHHTGIYIGGGQMIHAPHTGDVVKIGPVHSDMIYVRYPY